MIRDLVAEVGYDGISYELVARRAGASKPTLYRRWSSKREMVVAAIKAMPAAGTGRIVDTGTLRGDLLDLLGILAATLEASDTALVATLLEAGLADAELCDQLELSAGPTGARLPDAVRRRAIERRELPPGADPFGFDEVAGAVLVTRALNGLPFGADYREQLVDAVLLPALRASAATPMRHAGIFAGTHPQPEGAS